MGSMFGVLNPSDAYLPFVILKHKRIIKYGHSLATYSKARDKFFGTLKPIMANIILGRRVIERIYKTFAPRTTFAFAQS